MERVTFEEYEAAKAEVLYGKEYKETSSMKLRALGNEEREGTV